MTEMEQKSTRGADTPFVPAEPARPARFPRLARLWDRLSGAHPSVQDVGDRQQAQLAAALSLGLTILFILAVVISTLIKQSITIQTVFLLVMTVITAGTYLASRSPYYKWGSALLVIGLAAAGYSLAISAPESVSPSLYSILPTTLVLASLLLPLTGLATLVGINFLVIWIVLSRLIPSYTTGLVDGGIQLTLGVLLVIAVAYRNTVERLRVAEVTTVNKELRAIQASLEQRVEAATRNLTLAAEVGRSVAQVHEINALLKDAVDLVQKRFNLYYIQVYLLDQTGTQLRLLAGTGAVGQQLLGRHHSLPVDLTSLNGTAAVEKRAVIVEDTITSAIHRPNPLLPDTRSEMVIPMQVRDRVVGTLDMQSGQPGALNKENLAAFETLAAQLAIAVENAALLAEADAARADMEAQARRLTRANWADYLDAIHKPEEIGFVFEQNQVLPKTQDEAVKENALVAPIAVIGEPIGNLVVELGGQPPIARTDELVNTVARQVAQQVENLRLLESAERYRVEVEQASRRLTREGWKSYIVSSGEKLDYLYDLKEVLPVEEDRQAGGPEVTLPIKVREDAVGQLALMDIDPNDRESLELASAIAERLGAHIESLRQNDQTQSALTQSEKLYEASRRLTQATDLQELVNAAVGTLNIPRINRAVLATFNYDQTHNIESMDIIANWWDGSGHEVTPVGTHYPLDVIRAMPMFISSTPVFFNNTYTDERMDKVTMELVKRQNLNSVAILPLHVGAEQIGALILEGEEGHDFSQEEIRLFMALAPQVATVLENRRQFERAQKQAERETMLNSIGQKIRSATSVDAVLQIAARELGHALGAPLTIAQLGIKDKK